MLQAGCLLPVGGCLLLHTDCPVLRAGCFLLPGGCSMLHMPCVAGRLPSLVDDCSMLHMPCVAGRLPVACGRLPVAGGRHNIIIVALSESFLLCTSSVKASGKSSGAA
jgi:hypothetical protein